MYESSINLCGPEPCIIYLHNLVVDGLIWPFALVAGILVFSIPSIITSCFRARFYHHHHMALRGGGLPPPPESFIRSQGRHRGAFSLMVGQGDDDESATTALAIMPPPDSLRYRQQKNVIPYC